MRPRRASRPSPLLLREAKVGVDASPSPVALLEISSWDSCSTSCTSIGSLDSCELDDSLSGTPNPPSATAHARPDSPRPLLGALLGAGSSGSVWAAHCPSGHAPPLAVKRVTLTLESGRAAAREAELLRAAAHPHVVSLRQTYVQEGVLHLAMERARHGSLAVCLERQTNGEDARGCPRAPGAVARVAAHLTRALSHIHALGIAHGDLKPGNVLVCGEEEDYAVYKLADFGCARRLPCQGVRVSPFDQAAGAEASWTNGTASSSCSPNRSASSSCSPNGAASSSCSPNGAASSSCSPNGAASSPCDSCRASSAEEPSASTGTLQYASPERLAGAPASPAADVWALGVLLWECAAGRHPLAGPHHSVLDVDFWEALYGTRGLQARAGAELCGAEHALLASFVAACLRAVPGERLAAAELCAHPFVRGVC